MTTPPPKLVLDAMSKLNGFNPQLIIRKKKLFQCDVDINQARLQIPYKQMETSEFLTEDEKKILETPSKGKRKRKLGLSVTFVVPETEDHVVELHKWNKNYVFVIGWNQVVSDNEDYFKVGHVYSLWCFRFAGGNDGGTGNLSGDHTDSLVDGSGERKLCFALVPFVDAGHDEDHKNDLLEDSFDLDPFFDGTHAINHLDFDPEDSQGYYPGEEEDFGYNSDGSIRESGH